MGHTRTCVSVCECVTCDHAFASLLSCLKHSSLGFFFLKTSKVNLQSLKYENTNVSILQTPTLTNPFY